MGGIGIEMEWLEYVGRVVGMMRLRWIEYIMGRLVLEGELKGTDLNSWAS